MSLNTNMMQYISVVEGAEETISNQTGANEKKQRTQDQKDAESKTISQQS